MKIHAAIARSLVENGVEVVFGLIGDANMHYIADFIDSGHGRYVGSAIESGAASMADGYARVSGKVGVVSVTHGPAATNTVTAVTEAARAHTPLVLITGDPVARRGDNQRIDLASVFAATGAEYHQVLVTEHILDDIALVLQRAAAIRRPVVLNIPQELTKGSVDSWQGKPAARSGTSVGPDPDALDAAVGILATARRPVILAGRGAVLSRARDDLIALADRLGAPLATTASAKDLFHGHPYNLGISGSVATEYTSGVLAKADCVAAFGTSLSRYTIADGDLVDGRAVLHCDIEATGTQYLLHADVVLRSDVAATARAMTDLLDEADIEPTAFRTTQMGDGVLDRSPSEDFRDRSTQSTLDPRTAMIKLDELLPKDRVVVTDIGRFISAPWRYLHVQDAQDFVQTGAFASIGLGTSAAIGAAMAAPNRLTVGVAGDGGMMMGLVEMATAARNQIPLVMVVLNDNAYGAEYAKFESNGYDPKRCFVEWPDFADVARSLGCDGVTVRTIADLESALAGADPLERPLLLDVRTEPSIDPTVP